MTQEKSNTKRLAEFESLFMELNEEGQNAALIVLRSLEFAQSVMYSQRSAQQQNPTEQRL